MMPRAGLPVRPERRYRHGLGLLWVTWSLLCQVNVCLRHHGSGAKRHEGEEPANLQLQVAIDPYTHHKIPVLKMLKRQIRRIGNDANVNVTLTLAFYARQRVDINWFKVEVIDQEEMAYPILEDHSHYRLRTITSGDVTAVTLIMPQQPHHHRRHHPPLVFDTILTTFNPLMQYQIRTQVEHTNPTRRHTHDIDSPEWLIVPDTHGHLQESESFEHHCRVFVRRRRDGNALILMHAPPVSPAQQRVRPDFRIVVQTHDSGMENVVEESGNLILKGKLTPLKRSKDVLDVRAAQDPAESALAGLYMCAVERYETSNLVLDKLFMLSYVTFGGVPEPEDKTPDLTSVIPDTPRISLLTCATDVVASEIKSRHVELTLGTLGCLRCRAFSHPLAEVTIIRQGRLPRELASFGGVSMTSYVNVAEGGVVEAIYVFKNPQLELTGSYVCRAVAGQRNELQFFDITVRHR